MSDKASAKSGWSIDEATRIARSDDLYVSPFREDGKTYGTPTWIWSVMIEDALFARAYNGQQSRWYQSAMRQQAGRIRVGGIEVPVTFASVEGELLDLIDQAYQIKYQGSRYLSAMIGSRARGATVKILPLGR